MNLPPFELKDPLAIDLWLNEAPTKFKEKDVNFIMSIAKQLKDMEDFIYGNDAVCKEFFEYIIGDQKAIH
tara:strand:- start:317 stop:526 length:210 start_codon:yes stop_codon:yes gene_type:complete